MYFYTYMHACMLSHFSHAGLFAILWTIACQTPLSMGFSRQEQWSRLPCPPPGDLSNTEIEPTSLSLLHWQAGSLPLVPPGSPYIHTNICILFQILLILSWNFISLGSSFSRCDLVSYCFLNNRYHQKRTCRGSHPSAHLRASVGIDPVPPLVTVSKLCSCGIPPPVY